MCCWLVVGVVGCSLGVGRSLVGCMFAVVCGHVVRFHGSWVSWRWLVASQLLAVCSLVVSLLLVGCVLVACWFVIVCGHDSLVSWLGLCAPACTLATCMCEICGCSRLRVDDFLLLLGIRAIDFYIFFGMLFVLETP